MKDKTQGGHSDEWEMNKVTYLARLDRLKKQPPIEGHLPDQEHLFLKLLEHVAFLSPVVERMSEVGSSPGTFLEVNKKLPHAFKSLEKVSSQMGPLSVASAALEFLEIPLIYLASYILGREVPFKLSNNAKWLYASALLALAITSLALPAIAPFLIVATSGLIFASSVYTLGRFFYKRSSYKKELKALNKEDDISEKKLLALQDEADALKSELEQAKAEEQQDVLSRIDALESQFDAQKEQLQTLRNKKKTLEVTLDKMGISSVMAKGVSTLTSSLLLAGFVVALFFPPVGGALIVAWLSVGLSYIAGIVAHLAYKAAKTALPLLKKKFTGWLAKQFPGKTEDKLQEPESKVQADKQQCPVHEKTIDIMKGLFGSDKLEKALNELMVDSREMENLDSHLQQIVEKEDKKNILLFFNQLAKKVDKHEMTTEDTLFLLDRLNGINKGITLLASSLNALQKGEMTIDSIPHLAACEPLKQALGVRDLVEALPEEYKVNHQEKEALKTADEDEGESEGEGEKLKTH